MAALAVGRGLRSSARLGDGQEILLNNTLDAIEDGRLEILRHIEPLALGPRVINRLEVVFEELISNIVRHGFRPGLDQTIRVLLQTRPAAIVLTLEDDGRPFNLLTVPKPRPYALLDDTTVGGRGVAAVLAMANEVRYEALPPGGGEGSFAPRNRVTVAIAIPRV